MESNKEDGFSVPNLEKLISKFNELRSKEKLTTVAQKVSAMLCRFEVLLKQYPVRISLITFIVSIFLFAYFQNEFARNLTIAAFGSIFIAMTYRLNQATYHKNLFEDRFALFKTIDEILKEWACNNNATREMVAKLDGLMRKSHCVYSEQTYQFIKQFRMAIIILSYRIELAPDRKEVIEARNFLASLVDHENLPKKFPELKIDSY